jgi:dienelactone hydrolase
MTMWALVVGLLLASAPPASAPPASVPPGPHVSVMEVYASLPSHTVYRPRNAEATAPMPVVVWGNGGCRNLGNSAQHFLSHLASHGFLVIAVGPVGELSASRGVAGTNEPSAQDADGVWRPPTTTSAMIRALDWAEAEHHKPGALLEGRLDLAKVAVAGHSCGGLLALAASSDPRVSTTMIMNSGALNDGRAPVGVPATKGTLAGLRGPVLYVSGGASDVAHPNATDDVSRLRHVDVVHAYRDVGHSGTYAEPEGGAYGELAAAWLRWRLKGDPAAAAMFSPAGQFAQDPHWTLVSRPAGRR